MFFLLQIGHKAIMLSKINNLNIISILRIHIKLVYPFN